MDVNVHSDRCPLCGEIIDGAEAELLGYQRVLHVLDHAVRDALGIGIDCLGDSDLRDLCDVTAGTDWSAAVALATHCALPVAGGAFRSESAACCCRLRVD